MKKKKVTCKDLEGLRRLFPEISREEQRRYVAGKSPLMDESDLLTPVPSNGLEGGLTTSLNLGMNLGPDPRWERMEDSAGREEDPWIQELAPDVLPAVNSLSSGGYYDGGNYGYYYDKGWDIDGGELPEVVITPDNPYYYYDKGWDIDGEELPEVVITPDNPDGGYPYPDGDNEWWRSEYDYPESPRHDGEGYPDFYYGDTYGLEYGESSGGGGGSGSTGSGSTSTSNSQTDGVDVTNSAHFTFHTDSNPAFHEQLTKILESNSELKKLLTYFDSGYVHMNFYLTEDLEEDEGAETVYVNNEVYHMKFNSKFVMENGWKRPDYKEDNIGYDWGKVKTDEEALVVVLAHEAIHAHHYAIYYDACNETGGTFGDTYAYMIREMKLSPAFVNIFTNENKSGWGTSEEIDRNMHDYMRRNDLDTIDSILEEYRKDFNLNK